MAATDLNFSTAEKFAIFIQILCVFVNLVVIFPVIRYHKVFYDKHYFYKAAVLLAFMDIFGLICLVVDGICEQLDTFCLSDITVWIPYNMTQVMFLIIAFNRFCAVIFHVQYKFIFNSKWATWLFLIPILCSTICLPFYTCAGPMVTCWYLALYMRIKSIATMLILVCLILLYVSAFAYQRCFNTLNQLNEKRFLYQAAINSGFLIAVPLFWRYANNDHSLMHVVFTYLITAHFSCAFVVYLYFNRKLGRYVLHSISFGRIPVDNSVHAIVINVIPSNPE